MINILLINQHSYPPGKSNWRRHFDLFKNFSKEDYNNFYDKMCGEFSFLNSKIETKGYVQLMREKNGRN